MRRNIAEPFDAGGFEGDVWIQAPGHRLVDDRLPLLLQQRNQLPLRLNIPPHPPVHISSGSGQSQVCARGEGEES